MGALRSVVGAFVWFLKESVIVGGSGARYFVVPFAILVVGLVVTFPYRDVDARRRLPAFLVALPAIWVFAGLWGGFFWNDWQHKPYVPNPGWTQIPIIVAPWLSLIVCGVFTRRAKGARWFATAYALINLYFTLFMSFMSIMAVTGTWL